MARRAPAAAQRTRASARFNAERFLDSAGVERRIATYRPGARLFSQGDPASSVLYIQQGAVKLSVLSDKGKEAVVAILGPGDFFGEGCLAGQPRRFSRDMADRASRSA